MIVGHKTHKTRRVSKKNDLQQESGALHPLFLKHRQSGHCDAQSATPTHSNVKNACVPERRLLLQRTSNPPLEPGEHLTKSVSTGSKWMLHGESQCTFVSNLQSQVVVRASWESHRDCGPIELKGVSDSSVVFESALQ